MSIKRIFDIVISLVLLIVLALPMLMVALAVRLKMGPPVIFKQVRPGLHGKPFKLLKFRTMLETTDKESRPLADEHRLTQFGKWLRRSSLDELPELWNVLVGQMSLVGPRPLLTEYIPLYTHEQSRRHDVKPGITGWAQVNGRNAVDWDVRLRMDVWYVDNQTLLLDLKILMMTVSKVLISAGINKEGYATMEKFRGSGK